MDVCVCVGRVSSVGGSKAHSRPLFYIAHHTIAYTLGTLQQRYVWNSVFSCVSWLQNMHEEYR